ncbi:cobalamin biosynthesis protein CbiM [Thalassospira xiamenensis]|uniref:cobalt transporter CbiM n=1 Tax=Thalassospira xiamenensis TaxID=220697 RepID=UPI000DED6CAA|nr:cobalt transporter CbiM [Thalassospira xiamenensis]RCK33153.1 cobalamin biosynthesis protein CbiM [Thalassospira xiamenensis]
MHIVDGALSSEVVVTGAVLAVTGISYGLRKIDIDAMPRVAMMSAVFFVASLIHVPVGPSSAHLIVNGLAGLMLGWSVFPAIFIGLLLQAVFFGFGGITVLGVNTVNIALPAVLMWWLVSPFLARAEGKLVLLAGFVAGSGAIALSSMMVGLSLAASGQEFVPTAKLVVMSHIPVMVVEGILTAAAVHLVKKVRPVMLTPAGSLRSVA